MQDNTGKQKTAVQHTLPGWVLWVQEHLMLSFLILAEAYILGSLMATGWVKNIEDPMTWGWYGGAGVVLFFAAGMTAAGVGLRCSVTAADALAHSRWGLFLFNMLGLSVFSVSEIWASLSERSSNLQPTPADNQVLHILGVVQSIISPTVVIVAVLLPFATLFWGFSQQQSHVETAEERAERQQSEMAEARHKAQMRKVQAGGWASALRSAGQRLTSDQEEAGEPETAEPETPPDGDKPSRARRRGGKVVRLSAARGRRMNAQQRRVDREHFITTSLQDSYDAGATIGLRQITSRLNTEHHDNASTSTIKPMLDTARKQMAARGQYFTEDVDGRLIPGRSEAINQ